MACPATSIIIRATGPSSWPSPSSLWLIPEYYWRRYSSRMEGGGGPLAGRVTSLEPQARDPARVNLYLDGRFAFGLSAAVAAEARLRVGVVLSAADVAGLLRREASE